MAGKDFMSYVMSTTSARFLELCQDPCTNSIERVLHVDQDSSVDGHLIERARTEYEVLIRESIVLSGEDPRHYHIRSIYVGVADDKPGFAVLIVPMVNRDRLGARLTCIAPNINRWVTKAAESKRLNDHTKFVGVWT